MNDTLFKVELCDDEFPIYQAIVPKRAKFLSITKDDGKVYAWFTGNKSFENKFAVFVSFKEGEETLCSETNGITFAGSVEGYKGQGRLFFFIGTVEIDLDLEFDNVNLGWVLGWGVLTNSPSWNLHGVYKSEEKAKEVLMSLPSGYEVKHGSHRIGGDDFILSTSN